MSWIVSAWAQPINPVNGSYKIIAVRAEFQPDTNRFTTGTGRFNPAFLDTNAVIIDPLPHDANYFLAHLEFVKNYFERVSNQRVQFQTQLVSNVVELDTTMDFYAPLGDDNSENFKLAFLARDVWAKVAQNGWLNPGDILPARTAFVIFHAGAGRDIELLGTTLDKTPQDIPSVTLGLEGLQTLLDDASFQGFELGGGQRVTNTLIIPETESRPGANIDGSTLILQLSINGILTASVGSFLGLPDLFNTQNGRSGIGQFGLMDGAGIFAYSGMIPPEPSAWEKLFLGWAESETIVPQSFRQETTISIPHVTSRLPGAIKRIDINADEYYLIENRHRDPEKIGVTITIQRPDASKVTETFTNRDQNFTDQFIDSLRINNRLPAGVITDVSQFDFALPGGLDIGEDLEAGTEDDRELNGGILIWHIDEGIIRSRIDSNAVNNNEFRLGVDVEEADGAQDIGRPSSLNDNSVFLVGTAFDFWWSGNNARVILPNGSEVQLFENRFGADTFPANATNSGLPLSFELANFSDNLPTAEFTIRPIQQQRLLEPDFVFPDDRFLKTERLGFSPIPLPDGSRLVFNGQKIGRVNPQNGAFFTADLQLTQQPLLIADTILVTVSPRAGDQLLSVWGVRDSGLPQLKWERPTMLPNAEAQITFRAGQIVLNGTNLAIDVLSQSVSEIVALPSWHNADPDFIARLTTEHIISGNISKRLPSNFDAVREDILAFYTLNDQIEGIRALVATTQEFFFLGENANRELSITARFDRDRLLSPSFVDWDADKRDDVILTMKDRILVLEQNGTLIQNISIPRNQVLDQAYTFRTSALVTQENEQPFLWTLIESEFETLLLKLDGQGNPAENYPQYVFSSGNQGLTFSDDRVIIQANQALFEHAETGIRAWSYALGTFSSVIDVDDFAEVDDKAGDEFLVDAETYNWPNPADAETFVRVQTSEPSEVSITVVGLDGRILKQERLRTDGISSNELRFDTSFWGSGVYFARVSAKSSNNSGSKTIKIAVVH